MKKFINLLAVILMLACMTGYAFAHCGHCGIIDGYVCTKDNIASGQPGKCIVCGAELAKGDVKEGKDTEGKPTYEPAPANS